MLQRPNVNITVCNIRKLKKYRTNYQTTVEPAEFEAKESNISNSTVKKLIGPNELCKIIHFICLLTYILLEDKRYIAACYRLSRIHKVLLEHIRYRVRD